MENVIIKDLKEEDYEAVMKIRNPDTIYGGFDYIPDYYPVLMRLPGYRAFGAFLGNKLIGFSLLCLIDDGKTALGRAGRIHEQYEGKHLVGKFTRHFEDLYMPHIDSRIFAFSDAVTKVQNYTSANDKAKVILTKILYIYRTRQESLMAVFENHPFPTNVKIYTNTDLGELMESSNFCKQYFPEDRLFVDHVPYRLLKSNIPFIMSHRCMMLGTQITGKLNPNPGLLTFGNYVVCHAGILYNIDIYGQNLTELYNHLIVHFNRLRIFTNTDIQVEIICNDNVDEQLCNDTMQKFGLNRIKFFRSHLTCAEITYKQTSIKGKANIDKKSKL